MAEIAVEGHDRRFRCGEDDTILRAALRAGIGMPYSCNTGSCGNCRFELLEGEVRHLRADPPAHTDRDRRKNRWLGCQAVPGSDCRIKFRADPATVPVIPPRRRQGTLLERADLTHDMAEFAFRIEDGDDLFLPGQYALFDIAGVEGERVYSMCNLPGEGSWRFQIRRVPNGHGTGRLFGAEPGERVGLDGPYGLAYFREEAERDLVLVAGGSGLSPMVSIARAALAAPRTEGRAIHFFFGGRTVDDIRPGHVLDELTERGVRVVAAPSHLPDAAGWSGPSGFIHEVVDGDLGDALGAHEIYFAGPVPMSVALQKTLHARGVPQDRVHFDEFY